ncbi:MAG: nucleotide exchange factor GrpE [Candidatus Kerfeldbacteria bacterium]|nr:nucleotide exchange factor GrpE [Candidatus Kerfeldbacteria bacterium]
MDMKKTVKPEDSDECAKLRERIAELERQSQEHLDGWKRAKADYQNLQRDTAQERQRMMQFANVEIIHRLLPLVNYFQYAFHEIPDTHTSDPWITGVKHIYDQLLKFLNEEGITMMETIGKPFDPSLHESVGEVESTNQKPGTILEQTQPGFLMHGKCIRPAKVKIVKESHH